MRACRALVLKFGRKLLPGYSAPGYGVPSFRALGLGAIGLVALLPAALALLTCIPRSIPARDSGVFLYFGQQILNGQVPYRDLWDHKGPLLYFINALGLAMGAGSEWGVWALQFVALMLGLFLLWRLLSTHVGVVAAAAGVALGSASLGVTLEGGNFSEVYSIPLQAAAFCIYPRLSAAATSQRLRAWAGIGIIGALSFLMRPNNIATMAVITVCGMAAACGLAADSRRAGRVTQALSLYAACNIGALFLGATAVALPTAGYLITHGAVVDFVDQFFTYNFLYAGDRAIEHKFAVLTGGVTLVFSISSIVLISAAVARTAQVHVASRDCLVSKGVSESAPRDCMPSQRLFYVAALALILEMLLSALSGRFYPHYFVMWVVPLSVLLAFGFKSFGQIADSIFTSPGSRPLLMFVCWALLFFSVLKGPIETQLSPSLARIAVPPSLTISDSTSLILLREIAARSGSEHLLVWGAEAALNFAAKLPSPTRYVYQYPLMQCGYGSEAGITELFTSIKQRRPVIIDATATNNRILPIFGDQSQRARWYQGLDLAGTRRSSCKLADLFDPLTRFLLQNYRKARIQPFAPRWTVYVPQSGEIAP